MMNYMQLLIDYYGIALIICHFKDAVQAYRVSFLTGFHMAAFPPLPKIRQPEAPTNKVRRQANSPPGPASAHDLCGVSEQLSNFSTPKNYRRSSCQSAVLPVFESFSELLIFVHIIEVQFLIFVLILIGVSFESLRLTEQAFC